MLTTRTCARCTSVVLGIHLAVTAVHGLTRSRDLESLRRENESTKRFLHSVSETMREYARLQKDYSDLLEPGGKAIDDQVLAVIDLDPFHLPRSHRKPLAGTSWRAADEVAVRIQAQGRALDMCLSMSNQRASLIVPPGPELGHGLTHLLDVLKDLEQERLALNQTADTLASLEPEVERLKGALEYELALVTDSAQRSYGVKASAAATTSQLESGFARFVEVGITLAAMSFKWTITHKRVWVPLLVILGLYAIGDRGWARWVILYAYAAMVTIIVGAIFAFLVIVMLAFVMRGGYSNSSSFAN